MAKTTTQTKSFPQMKITTASNISGTITLGFADGHTVSGDAEAIAEWARDPSPAYEAVQLAVRSVIETDPQLVTAAALAGFDYTATLSIQKKVSIN
jgi:hypothetical protein